MGKMAKGKGKKKAKNTSNVFSMFEQSQIQEFKEAFGMIDANRDGFIDKEDLKSTYASLGVMSIESSKLDQMMSEAPAAINFTVFLNMMAAAPIDADGNLDYKGLAYVITHGQEEEVAEE